MSDNLAIWDALSRTDPKHTKQFKRAGGFSGTAIKPMWIVHKLTAQFGSIGHGWGMGEPTFQVVQAGDELLVYCTVRCWHGTPDNAFYGVGGDKVRTARQNGAFNDDEAFKKAFTDAVGNAFKFVGVGADVHMGQFEDSKYVQAVAREYAEQARDEGQSQRGAVSPRPDTSPHTGEPTGRAQGWREPTSTLSTPSKLAAEMRRLERELAGCGDSQMIYGLTASDEWREFARVALKHAPHYLRGGEPAPPEFEGLANTAERLVREFEATKEAA